ncbi:hypothetical protein ACOI8A_05605 [Pseudomonas sp. P4795]|uniref:hypothetical protein n=1 Tax=Pseudomonas sp. P4795 TaxID=3409915 RepID=UPI003B590B2E
MAMKITMIGTTIKKCGTVFSVGDGDVDIKLVRTKIVDCETAILQRDPIGALTALGLPSNVPHELVVEALNALYIKQPASVEEKAEVVKSSRLGAFIQHAANATAITQGLVALSPALIQSLLPMLN